MKILHQSRFFYSVLVILLLLVLVGIVVGKPLYALFTSFFSAPPQPRALGVAINGFPEQAATLLDAYTKQVGGTPATAAWYISMTDPFNKQQRIIFTNRGIEPMISAGNPPGYTDAQIAAGAIDTSLHSFAHEAASWGRPFFYRLDWEMNGNWMAFGPGQNGNTDQSFIAMWQHVVRLFRQNGAHNAQFVFSPNTICSGACTDFTPMYPGNDYVDWVGLDGYNWGNVHTSSHWDSFTTIFGPSYHKLVALAPSKPVMIAETASTEQGGNKATWITQTFFRDIPNNFPLIKLIVWFDFNKETDWRVNSSPAALQAYRSVVQSPLYQHTFVQIATPSFTN